MERDFKSTIIADNVPAFTEMLAKFPEYLHSVDTEGNNILHLSFMHNSTGVRKHCMQLLLDENIPIVDTHGKKHEAGLVFAVNQKNAAMHTAFHSALSCGAA